MLSITHLLLLLLLVVLIFGTKKLRNIGSDLGSAVSNFKKGLDGDEAEKKAAEQEKLQADPPVAQPTAAAREHDQAK